MRHIKSSVLFFFIHVVRFTDHLHRALFGLPQLERSQITPQLYLGGQYTKRGFIKMQKIGITGIVNMRQTPIPRYEGMNKMKTMHLPTIDLNAPTIADLKKGILFIQKEIERDGKIYIHCRLGEGRGPTMMIAYLLSTGLTLHDSLILIKGKRPFIQPTKPQMKQLKKLEKEF